jgi:hypothetical protein
MVQNEFLKVFFFRFMVRNKIPSVFLFFKMIQKGIPSIVYLPRKGSGQNYEVLNVFFVYKMVRNCIPSTFVFLEMVRNEITLSSDVFSSQNRSERNSALFFIFRGMAWNGILSVFRFAKQMEIRRKKTKNFRFSRKMAPLLLSDHLLDFFAFLASRG